MSLRVENGALTIRNGFTHYPQQREIIRYFHGDVALPERTILLDGSGSISFDVLSWLAEQKVSFIRIDWKGDIVCVVGASGYSANPFRVRWQLETRENPEQRNEFCRSIITRKIEATIITLEKSIPRSDKWERAMRSAYAGVVPPLEENPPETISELRVTLRPEFEVGPGGLEDGFVTVSGLGPSWSASGVATLRWRLAGRAG